MLLAHGIARQFACDAPFVHHQYAVAMQQQLLHVRREHQNGAARRGEFVEGRVNLRAGMDVHALGRITQQQDLGTDTEPFADNDFLLNSRR